MNISTFEKDGNINTNGSGIGLGHPVGSTGKHFYLEDLEDRRVKIHLSSGNMDENFRGLQTWFNELYVKDISKKTKAALRTKQKNGEINVTHFGYRKDPTNKTKCIIDEEAAETVRLLFRLYAEGNGLQKIAKYLNENHVETPAIRKEKLYGYRWIREWDFKHLWYGEGKGRRRTEYFEGNH